MKYTLRSNEKSYWNCEDRLGSGSIAVYYFTLAYPVHLFVCIGKEGRKRREEEENGKKCHSVTYSMIDSCDSTKSKLLFVHTSSSWVFRLTFLKLFYLRSGRIFQDWNLKADLMTPTDSVSRISQSKSHQQHQHQYQQQ